MRIEETIVNIIFDAGKGNTPVESREGICGNAYGELPRPVRPGYTFEGWYLGEQLIGAETVLEADGDIRLTARWAKKQSDGRKKTVIRKQQILACALAVLIVVLSVGIAVANNLVAIYHVTDRYYDENGAEQTERYTVKRQNGVYKMFNRKGELMDTVPESAYDASGVHYEVYEARTSGNLYLVNTSTGECSEYAIVDYDGNIGESLGGTVVNRRVMMFEHIGQDNTYSIEVTNQYGTYKFYRETVENTKAGAAKKYTTAVRISGMEASLVAYDPTLFASLCVSCGYTLTMQKLNLSDAEAPRRADGSIDYNAYGLEKRYDENGTLIYSPAIYTVTKAFYAEDGSCSSKDKDGNTVSYTVTVGDAILSGGGYYVKLEGRDAVYITSNTIADTVLQPVEALVTPMVIYPMSVSTYVMVYDFRLAKVHGEEIDLISAFNFVDLSKRENTLYSTIPYEHSNVSLMDGYQFNSDSVSAVLQSLYQMEFVKCCKLNPTDEDLKAYHLLDDETFFLTFSYDPAIANGGSPKEEWINNVLTISQKTENGTYYIYSCMTDQDGKLIPGYNMIVEVDQSYLTFLEWEKSKWYQQYFFSNNIANVKNISITMNGEQFDFVLDNSLTYAFYYDEKTQKATMIDLGLESNKRNTRTGTLSEKDGELYYTVTKTGVSYPVRFVDFENGEFFRGESSVYNPTTGKTTDESGKIFYRDPDSNARVEITLTTTNLKIFCNGKEIDYLLENKTTTDAGKEDTRYYTALDNFRRFYQKLLWYSIEGDVSQKELGTDVKSYIAAHDPSVVIRYSVEDMAKIMNPEHFTENNCRNLVIRLYEYPSSGEKFLLTIEVLEGPDAESDPARAQGSFYVDVEMMRSIYQYAHDFVDQTLIPSST